MTKSIQITQNIPLDVWRHIFSLKLKDDPLFIFEFTKEIIILGEYMKDKNEIREMVKNAIIRNFELTKVTFFDYCLKNNKEHILSSKIFLDNINVLNSIDDCLLFIRHITWFTLNNYDFIKYIIIENNTILVEWLIIKKKDININLSFCNYAARNNNLKMLKFLREKNNPCPWSEWCVYEAVRYNNFEMLRFLREGNDPCPWDRNCCQQAILNNNLEILKFMREGNDPCPWHEDCAPSAVKNNNLEMLRFLREGNDPCPWDKKECLKICIENNNLEMLRLLREGNDPCS